MSSAVATRYAKALLASTKQNGAHAKAMEQLRIIDQALCSDADLKTYFSNPAVSPENKSQVLKQTFSGKGFLDEVVSCLLLMAERGRLGIFSDFVTAFQEGLDDESGVTRGIVRAAKPLTNEAQAELEKKITTVLKKKIVLTFKEDPNLLGGVVAEVGGWTFDDSIETHLKRMNEELNRRAY